MPASVSLLVLASFSFWLYSLNSKDGKTVACCASVDFSTEIRGIGLSCFSTLDGVKESSRIQRDGTLGLELMKFAETQIYSMY